MVNTVLTAAARTTAILGLLLLTPALATAQNPDSSEINNLLKEAKTHAVLAEDDASTLESYTFSEIPLQSHASRMSKMQEHANDLIEDFNKLGTLKPSGSPWQQDAIDNIRPLLQSMSAHMTATINHLNENRSQGQVRMQAYKDYVMANRKLVTNTARLISDVVDYGESKAKAEALQKALTPPVTARENP